MSFHCECVCEYWPDNKLRKIIPVKWGVEIAGIIHWFISEQEQTKFIHDIANRN